MAIPRLVPALALALVLAVIAAGCGGGGQSAEEKWAGDVCSAVTTWKTTVTQATDHIQSTLQSPQAGMVTSIKTDVQSAVTATNKLVTDLKSLTPPNTDEGKKAQQAVDSLATQVQTTATQAKQISSQMPATASAADTIKAFAPLAPGLQSISSKTESALTAIQSAGSSIKDGFKKAGSCKPYRR